MAVRGNARSCRQQGLPDCHGAGASVRRCMPDGSVIRTAKLIVGPTAEGERRELRPGRSGCRRCLDLDPGPQMDTSPGSSSGPEPGSPCPGMPRRNRLPQPRPPGRRPMRPPGSPIFLFRYHAERRGRAEENARGPRRSALERSLRSDPLEVSRSVSSAALLNLRMKCAAVESAACPPSSCASSLRARTSPRL